MKKRYICQAIRDFQRIKKSVELEQQLSDWGATESLKHQRKRTREAVHSLRNFIQHYGLQQDEQIKPVYRYACYRTMEILITPDDIPLLREEEIDAL